MGGTKARNWIAGTAVIAIIMVVAAWFLAVTPQLAAAQETRVSTEDELARQDILRAQLATLRAQFEEIETYRTEVAALQAQIPSAAKLSDYLRELQTIASAHSVTVIGMTPGMPAMVIPPVAAVAAAAPAEVTDAPADAAAVAPEPVAPTSRLVSIPMPITVVGTYANVAAFLETLQTGTSRLYLVTSMTASMMGAVEASGGRPATAPGDVEVTVDGVIYVLPADPAAVTGTDDTATPEPAPLPTSDRNPFAPVVGS